MQDFFATSILLVICVIALTIVILRWILRINHIIARLDKIIILLDGTQTDKERPKSFMDSLRKGMKDD